MMPIPAAIMPTKVTRSLILPVFMTSFVTVANLGLTERLLVSWMRTWGLASLAAFPLILVFQPVIKRLVG